MHGSNRIGRLLTAAGIAVSLAGTTLALAAPAQAAAAPTRTSAVPTRVRHATTTSPTISALYAEIEDAANGSVVWGKSQNTEVPMGSITKVMTALVVIETAGTSGLTHLDTVPQGITAYDEDYGASTAGLVPGEQLTTLQLLYALLVPSGCDAAYTLAQAYGPGLSAFIAEMNTKAAALGLKHTHFPDFSGLPDPTETSTYSTASDLITLGRDAMQLPLFATIVKTSSYQVPAVTGNHPAFTWNSTNPILGVYPGAIGLKTGSTNGAGYCLLFEAVKNDESVIGVVLDDPTGFSVVAADATTLLNYGFAHFPAS